MAAQRGIASGAGVQIDDVAATRVFDRHGCKYVPQACLPWQYTVERVASGGVRAAARPHDRYLQMTDTACTKPVARACCGVVLLLALAGELVQAAPRAARRAPAAPAVPAPAVPAAAVPGPAEPPQRCASGPARADYVSLRAATASSLASVISACERLGYRPVGGVARAIDANPGAPSAQWYYQVMVVPAGATSAPAAAGSSATR